MDKDNFLEWYASVRVSGVKLILVDFVTRPINEEKLCTKISKPIQCQDYYHCTYCNAVTLNRAYKTVAHWQFSGHNSETLLYILLKGLQNLRSKMAAFVILKTQVLLIYHKASKTAGLIQARSHNSWQWRRLRSPTETYHIHVPLHEDAHLPVEVHNVLAPRTPSRR